MREIYSGTVLEARNLTIVSLGQNQGVGRAEFPPDALVDPPLAYYVHIGVVTVLLS